MPQSTGTHALAALIALGAIAATVPARAEPPSDPSSIWTLQDENSSITSSKFNDKYYVNGLRLGWTSPTDAVPDFLSNIGRNLWGDGRQRLSIDLAQSIFTPADTLITIPDPNDRPYAGVLLADATLVQDSDTTRNAIGLQVGLVGPDAGGQQLQNGFHGVVGFGNTMGWNSQLRDQPILELLDERTWRVPVSQFGGFEVDLLPTLEGGVGDLRVYGLAGSVVRFGQGLDADFGVARVQPGLSGSDAYVSTRPFGWYLFAGVDGQLVGYDVTINGNAFRSGGPSTGLVPVVGEAEGGLAFLVAGTRISYTQIVQTEEVRGQHGGPHQFGSLSISAKF
jgi:lipid A 3-O-deacylase